MSETIKYRGETINVGRYRERYQQFPYLSKERIEELVQRDVRRQKQFIGRMLGREQHGGYRLAFYYNEHQLFPEAYNLKVSDQDAKKVMHKLLQHFGNSQKAKSWVVRFYGHRDSGSCGWGIRLSHNPSIGLICHEVCHTFVRRHGKKMMKLMKRMVNYCKKKDYWKMTTEKT